MDPTTCTAFFSDLSSAQYATRHGVVAQRAASSITHWGLWLAFCTELAIDPFLENIPDPVEILQVFLHRVRVGKISPRSTGQQVRGRSAEDTLRSVGQAFAGMGAPDPRYTPQGKMDFRLTRQLKYYAKQDPSPNRVKPVPLTVIRHVLFAALAAANPSSIAIADMIVIAFFFLLRPGEYTGTPSDTSPFRLCDARLSVGGCYLDPATCSDAALQSATFTSLTFTNQKNGVRGEVIGLGRSKDPNLCPVLAIIRRVLHLRRHGAPPDTPLATYYSNGSFHPVEPSDITTALRTAVTILGPATLGFNPADITARCLRAAGAMALLCSKVDTDIIRLIGRWRSDEMLRYLHVQAEPVMRDYAAQMIAGGNFVLHPNADVPLN